LVQSFHRDAEIVLDVGALSLRAEPALPGRATGLWPGRPGARVRAAAPDVLHVNGSISLAICARSQLGCRSCVQDHASSGGRRRQQAAPRTGRHRGIAFNRGRQIAAVRRSALSPSVPVFSRWPESSTRFSPGQPFDRARTDVIDGDPAVFGGWDGSTTTRTALTILERDRDRGA